MTRGIESPSRFVLLVEWDSVEAHLDNFRGTDRFAQWRGAIGAYFAVPPLVEHFTDVPAPADPPMGAGPPCGPPTARAIDACHDPGAAAEDLAVVRRARVHRVLATAGPPPGRRDARPARAGVVSFDFRGHGRSGGASTVGDREVLDLEAAVALGPRARVRAGRHARLLDGRVGGGPARRRCTAGWPRWSRSAGPAAGTTAAPSPMRRVHWVIERPLGRIVEPGRAADPDLPPAGPTYPSRRTRWPRGSRRRRCSSCTATPTTTSRSSTPRQLYAAAAEPKELWIEPGFGHAENAASPELVERIGDLARRDSRSPPRGGSGCA